MMAFRTSLRERGALLHLLLRSSYESTSITYCGLVTSSINSVWAHVYPKRNLRFHGQIILHTSGVQVDHKPQTHENHRDFSLRFGTVDSDFLSTN